MNWQKILTQLQNGEVRAAYQDEQGQWQANVEVKQAILAAFKAGENDEFDGIYQGFVDKHNLPARAFSRDDSVRLVPGGSSVRTGAYVAPGVIIMPHALVGSCAQIGRNVHLSAAVQIGGVLEPIGASPVIIEDDAFLGAGVVVVEGIVVKKGAVLAPGVSLSASVPVFDLVNQRRLDKGEPIPERAVVIPGTRPVDNQWAQQMGLNMSCALIVKYRDEQSDASLELESVLR